MQSVALMQVGFRDCAVFNVAEQPRQGLTQRAPQGGRGEDGFERGGGFAHQAGGGEGFKLQDMVADGDAGARRFVRRAEHTERQVLDRKIRMAWAASTQEISLGS